MNNRHIIIGKVVSNAKYHEGTLVVEVTRAYVKGKMKKQVSKKTRYTVEYLPKTEIEIGKFVKIAPCRPLSKTKRFIFVGEL